jgi:GT2 family glycosyltransferase
MKKKVVISVIIPCFNGEKYLVQLIKSLLAVDFPDFEIIIVDDGSTDESVKKIKDLKSPPVGQAGKIKNLILIENKKNQGAAKSRNIGAKKARGKYLLFLDVDTKVHPQCLSVIVEKLEKNPQIGAIQTKLDTGGHFLTPFGFPYEIPAGKEEKIIFGARTAGMAIRKDLFEKIRGFDEDYFIYGEDTDLSWRVWLAGKKIVYLPKAKVHHFGKSSLTKNTSERIFYEGVKNNLSNLVKNSSLTLLILVLPLYLFSCFLLSFKQLLVGNFSGFSKIYQGIFWNFTNIKKTLKKRRQINLYRQFIPPKIIFGKLDFLTCLKRGTKWLVNI